MNEFINSDRYVTTSVVVKIVKVNQKEEVKNKKYILFGSSLGTLLFLSHTAVTTTYCVTVQF